MKTFFFTLLYMILGFIFHFLQVYLSIWSLIFLWHCSHWFIIIHQFSFQALSDHVVTSSFLMTHASWEGHSKSLRNSQTLTDQGMNRQTLLSCLSLTKQGISLFYWHSVLLLNVKIGQESQTFDRLCWWNRHSIETFESVVLTCTFLPWGVDVAWII